MTRKHRIAFLPAGSEDFASSRIRVYTLQRALVRQGGCASFKYSGNADVLVVQKRVTPEILGQAREAKLRGGTVIYDVDDLGDALWVVVPWQAFRTMVNLADVVTTDTEGHRVALQHQYDVPRVEVIPDGIDYYPDQPVRPALVDADPLRVLWFGMGGDLTPFKRYLDALSSMRGVESIITIHAKAIREHAAQYPGANFIPWSRSTFLPLLQSCHLSCLLHEDSEVGRAKSNNRMITSITWGVPAVVSRTPEYERTAQESGVADAVFNDENELRAVIERMRPAKVRSDYLAAAQPAIWSSYGPQVIAGRFMEVVKTYAEPSAATQAHNTEVWAKLRRRTVGRAARPGGPSPGHVNGESRVDPSRPGTKSDASTSGNGACSTFGPKSTGVREKYPGPLVEWVPCPKCGSDRSVTVNEGPDLLYGVPGTFRAAECENCGFQFLNPRPIWDAIPELYPSFYGPHSLSQRHDAPGPLSDSWRERAKSYKAAAAVRPLLHFGRATVQKVRDWVAGSSVFHPVKGSLWWALEEQLGYRHFNCRKGPVRLVRRLLFQSPCWRDAGIRLIPHYVADGKLLEIGCGAGEQLEFLRQLGWRYLEGIEPATQAAELTRARGFAVKNELVESALDSYPDGHFDAVTSAMVFEHLCNPFEVVKSIARKLKPGGELLFSTQIRDALDARLFGSYWGGYDHPRHFVFFRRKDIAEMLEGAFEGVECYFQNAPIDYVRAAKWRLPEGKVRDKLLLGLFKSPLGTPVGRVIAALGQTCRVSFRCRRKK